MIISVIKKSCKKEPPSLNIDYQRVMEKLFIGSVYMIMDKLWELRRIKCYKVYVQYFIKDYLNKMCLNLNAKMIIIKI